MIRVPQGSIWGPVIFGFVILLNAVDNWARKLEMQEDVTSTRFHRVMTWRNGIIYVQSVGDWWWVCHKGPFEALWLFCIVIPKMPSLDMIWNGDKYCHLVPRLAQGRLQHKFLCEACRYGLWLLGFVTFNVVTSILGNFEGTRMLLVLSVWDVIVLDHKTQGPLDKIL